MVRWSLEPMDKLACTIPGLCRPGAATPGMSPHPENVPRHLALPPHPLILVAEASFLELTPLPHLVGSGDYNSGTQAATPVPAIVSESDSTCL